MKQKLIALVLCLVMVMSLVPTAWATPSGTLVLYNGRVYMNSTATDITNAAENEGLTYDSAAKVWKMNNFTYNTSTGTALMLMDATTTILVTGNNTITSGTGGLASITNSITTDGDCELIIKGSSLSDTLTVTAGQGIERSVAIDAEFLTLDTVTVSANGGIVDGDYSVGIDTEESLTVKNADVTATGAIIGMVIDGLTITGTGKIVAAGGSCSVMGHSEAAPNVVAKVTGTETVPTWEALGKGCIYMNGADIATSTTLTAHAASSGSRVASGHTITSDLKSVDKVSVDGKMVDSKYYTVFGGSVTLSAEFLKTLASGTHTVTLENTGYIARATITVDNGASVNSPKTGDMSVVLYGALAVSSLLGTGVVLGKRKEF